MYNLRIVKIEARSLLSLVERLQHFTCPSPPQPSYLFSFNDVIPFALFLFLLPLLEESESLPQLSDTTKHSPLLSRLKFHLRVTQNLNRNVGYDEETRKTDWGDRDEDATMDVRSDAQRQDQERMHPRDDESGAGFQRDPGDDRTGAGMWWTEMNNTYWGKCWESMDTPEKRKRGVTKNKFDDACQRDMKSTGQKAGKERVIWRRKIIGHSRQSYMTGKEE